MKIVALRDMPGIKKDQVLDLPEVESYNFGNGKDYMMIEVNPTAHSSGFHLTITVKELIDLGWFAEFKKSESLTDLLKGGCFSNISVRENCKECMADRFSKPEISDVLDCVDICPNCEGRKQFKHTFEAKLIDELDCKKCKGKGFLYYPRVEIKNPNKPA